MLRTIAATILAALALTASAAAAPPDLAALGYTVSLIVHADTGCSSYRVTGYGADVTFTTDGYLCKETVRQEAAMHAFAAGHEERKAAWEAANPPVEQPPAEDDPPAGEEPPPTPQPTVDPRVSALEATVAALTAKVATLQAAVEVAWKALVDALAAGQTPWEAALGARSAGLNALYGL